MTRNATTRREIAARLKEARSRIYRSAADAARALDVNPVTLRAHEAGQNGISPTDLERYTRRYGVDVGWLLTGKGSPEPGVESPDLQSWVLLWGEVQDGAWIPSPGEGDFTIERDHNGDVIAIPYSDPRFPPAIVNALRVRSNKQHGPYPDGSIIFAVSSDNIDFRDGDHVILVRARGEFIERTVKRVSHSERKYYALTSDDAPFGDDEPEGTKSGVVGVVVGALIRRDVNQLSLEKRRELEEAVDETTYHDFPSWRA